MSAARGTVHSVRHQQGSLCHVEGHHGREEEGDRQRRRRFPRWQNRAHAKSGKDLRSGKNQENRVSHRCPQGSRREAGGKAQIRSAGDLSMKILVVTEQRQGKWNNTSFETLAAAQQIAAAGSGSVAAAVVGKGLDALAAELSAKKVSEVLQVE